MFKEKKWCTFLGFGPASLSYRARAASYPLSLGSKPCNNIKSYIGEISPQISKRKEMITLAEFVTKNPTTISLNIASIVYLKRQESTYFSL